MNSASDKPVPVISTGEPSGRRPRKSNRSTDQDQQQIARSLKTFQSLSTNKEKATYLCYCTEQGLNAFSQLFKQVLRGRLQLPADILKQLKPLKRVLGTIASSHVTARRKRKILTNAVVRSVLYPFLRKYIIPLGLKWLSKVTGRQFITAADPSLKTETSS